MCNVTGASCRWHMTPKPGLESNSQPLPSASARYMTSFGPRFSSVTQKSSPGWSVTWVFGPSMSGSERTKMGKPSLAMYRQKGDGGTSALPLAALCRSHILPTPGFWSKAQPRPSASSRNSTPSAPAFSCDTQKTSPGCKTTSDLGPSIKGTVRTTRDCPSPASYRQKLSASAPCAKRSHMVPTPGFRSKAHPRPSDSRRYSTPSMPNRSSKTSNKLPGASVSLVRCPSTSGSARMTSG
mmetsp:Transcript_5263/g.15692  ORF Transcript_5263/g.15692 Transcript_5263/m.15692 type:complete len:239 (+) Transcript_5263:544-1260(+)